MKDITSLGEKHKSEKRKKNERQESERNQHMQEKLLKKCSQLTKDSLLQCITLNSTQSG